MSRPPSTDYFGHEEQESLFYALDDEPEQKEGREGVHKSKVYYIFVHYLQ